MVASKRGSVADRPRRWREHESSRRKIRQADESKDIGIAFYACPLDTLFNRQMGIANSRLRAAKASTDEEAKPPSASVDSR